MRSRLEIVDPRSKTLAGRPARRHAGDVHADGEHGSQEWDRTDEPRIYADGGTGVTGSVNVRRIDWELSR